MYEYNFNDIRKTIEEILDKSLTKSKEAYYNQLEIFKKDQDDNESLKDVKVKKKKIIMKDQSNGQANIEKEVIDFEDVENLKFETFYNVGFGLFEMTSEIIYKTVYNIKFEYVIFKNCIFKNIQFENCIFLGCEFLDCTFLNTKFKEDEFFNFNLESIAYFSNSSFHNCIFDKDEIESIYFSDCNLKSFSMINSKVYKLEFDDEFVTKLNENTFFDKFIYRDKNKEYYASISKTYKNIASQFESNRILNISGEYHYLYKCSQSKTLEGFSKFKSKIFWLTCGYGERPTYALITSLEIVLIFAIIYMFTGISIGDRLINYNLTSFSILEKKLILVDFLESLYFSLVTFTTVGYGDIIPIGTSIILSSIEMILGVTLVGIWTATLARKITR